jgi:hypothetical protein
MMARETTYTGKLGSLRKFGDSLKANSAELPQLEANRMQFDDLVTKAEGLSTRQAALTAEKQENSKQLREAVTEAERLGTVLRLGVKHHFGIRAEKLAEFSLRPFRGRKTVTRAKKSPPDATLPTAPAEPAEPTK